MNQSFCPLPWVGLHYGCDGYIYPCCYINQKNINEYRLGQVKNGVESSFNSDKIREMRLAMLKGERINACEGCYRREDLGFESFRLWKNKQYQIKEMVKETSPDGFFPFKGFKYFELKISNLCNLRCRICDSGSSTGWYKEENIIGSEQNCFSSKEEFLQEFKKNEDKVDLIYFFGGEPFLINYHYDLIDYLYENKKFDVEIHYSTNLTVYNKRVEDCLLKLKSFKKVVIIGSLDGSGKKFEFLRKNSIWSTVRQNILRFSEYNKNNFIFMPSLCNLNINSIFDTLEDFIENNIIFPENIILNMVFEPKFLAYNNLGPILKAKTLLKIDKFKSFVSRHINKNTVNIINTENIIYKLDKINESICNTKEYNLKDFFDKMVNIDNTRKENFLHVFPEFIEDLKNEKLL